MKRDASQVGPVETATLQRQYQASVARVRRRTTAGIWLLTGGAVSFLAFFAFYQQRNLDAVGFAVLLVLIAVLVAGAGAIGFRRYVRCPSCRRFVFVAQTNAIHCQKCGGEVDHSEVAQGLLRLPKGSCKDCSHHWGPGDMPLELDEIRNCPHCGLKLMEK